MLEGRYAEANFSAVVTFFFKFGKVKSERGLE